MNTPPTTFKPMTLALAGAGLALTALLPLAFAQAPAEYRVWNASVIGALALFAAARLGLWQGLALTAVAIALKDLGLYLTTAWWEPYPPSWLYFAGYALSGWALLRRSPSVGRAVGVSLGASVAFFFVSNFVSWLELALPYERSLGGLLSSYAAGVPFYRGTLLGDVGFGALFFGAHAVLARAYFPAERVNAAPAAHEAEGNW
ncbi:hypothetical protein GobsT_08130 [Gemmata obscuriglobus]|uniref:ECF transporter S component n=1 Tax=Gemmata obscuriglobus TaxID=114 RepID=A0A2Z3H1L4_9BACT|nr:DUF6580 family putative transport protein [Gemmata obscuriglobus]AWM40659.1 hypothetical protein C1280_29195 [Gemmata obscuriglobus]QEG26078.1 hypothetical protein GobsT_08130 [Gemmata obscuriglobus]VTS00517.1 Uncharacterized protein OS=uncultured bacterium Lac36W PE=4 SV=1 [Gemmata obscuriglobus UQM 2246]